MATPAPPPNYAVPSSKVELSVLCRNLPNKDTLSKSDPMCVVFHKPFGTNQFIEFGRTEIIYDTLDPQFVHKFVIEYRFEESQALQFSLYDSDSKSAKLSQHDFLGSMECTLGEIVSAGKFNKQLLAKRGGSAGDNKAQITVRSEELIQCNEVLHCTLYARNCDKKDFFGKSDPFLVFYKCNEDESFTACHKTEVIKNTLDPNWQPLQVHLTQLSNGDKDRTIKIECYDWDSDGGSHDLIGCCLTNARELSTPGSQFELINPKKKAKKKSYKNSGVLHVNSGSLEKMYGFLDYITSGVQINFTVAVDFTQSNGEPNQPGSLHYIDPSGAYNQYMTALLSVGSIVQDYDSDKMFPALGFGGKLPNNTVSHEFFLNGHPENPFCSGISGVMQAYQQAIRTVALWGPTNFAPVINHVAKFASAIRDGSNYFILLIITDGVITDMPQTKSAIINASSLPMSIIIIGVGNADFSAMEELDGDKTALSVGRRTAERDIVQFVALREYLNKQNSAGIQAHLAKAVLAEVPDQFVQYMKKHNILPPANRNAQSFASAPPP